MPRPLRSLRNRLTLIFALIVAGAIAIVYFYVTPRLEEQLVAQKLERLAVEAARESPPLQQVVGTRTPQGEVQRRTVTAAARSSAEVTVLQVGSGAMRQILPVADSNPGGAGLADIAAVAEQAVGSRETVTSTEQTDVGRRTFHDRRDIDGEGIRIETGRVQEDEPDVVGRGQARGIVEWSERGEGRSPRLHAE